MRRFGKSRFSIASEYATDKIAGSVSPTTTTAGLFTQLMLNCTRYAESYNRDKKNGIARELFAGVLTEDQIKEVFDSEV